MKNYCDQSVRRVVYTAIFGGYDRPSPINFKSACDFVCFTDDSKLNAPGWKLVIIDDNALSLSALNRKIKILPQLYLSTYEESLYVDGNISIRRDPFSLFDKYLCGNVFFAAPAHPYRDCLYDEAEALLNTKRFTNDIKQALKEQVARYRTMGIPSHTGLTENNVLLRSHHHERQQVLSELWWKEYMSGCPRDQIALPYAVWAADTEVAVLAEGPRRSNPFFDINLHAGDITDNPILNFVRVARYRTRQSNLYRLLGSLVNAADRMHNLLLNSRMR